MILQHHARFQMYVRAGFRYVGVCAIQLCTLGWKGSCETVHGTFWDSVNSVNFRLFLIAQTQALALMCCRHNHCISQGQ